MYINLTISFISLLFSLPSFITQQNHSYNFRLFQELCQLFPICPPLAAALLKTIFFFTVNCKGNLKMQLESTSLFFLHSSIYKVVKCRWSSTPIVLTCKSPEDDYRNEECNLLGWGGSTNILSAHQHWLATSSIAQNRTERCVLQTKGPQMKLLKVTEKADGEGSKNVHRDFSHRA